MLMQHVGVGYFGYYRATIYVGFQAGNLDFSATSNGVGCILAGSSQYTLVSGPYGPLTRRYAPTSGKPSSGPLRPRTETLSWLKVGMA